MSYDLAKWIVGRASADRVAYPIVDPCPDRERLVILFALNCVDPMFSIG